MQQLSCPVTVHAGRAGVGSCRAGLHCCGDSSVTDDRRPGGHEPRRRGRRGRRGHGGGHRFSQDAGNGGVEARRVQDPFVVALFCGCRGAAVFRGLGAVREAVTSFATFPGYGELVGIFAIFPQHLREKSPACVNEPVAHLQKTITTTTHTVRKARHMARFHSALRFKRKSAGTFIPRCSLHMLAEKSSER